MTDPFGTDWWQNRPMVDSRVVCLHWFLTHSCLEVCPEFRSQNRIGGVEWIFECEKGDGVMNENSIENESERMDNETRDRNRQAADLWQVVAVMFNKGTNSSPCRVVPGVNSGAGGLLMDRSLLILQRGFIEGRELNYNEWVVNWLMYYWWEGREEREEWPLLVREQKRVLSWRRMWFNSGIIIHFGKLICFINFSELLSLFSADLLNEKLKFLLYFTRCLINSTSNGQTRGLNDSWKLLRRRSSQSKKNF